MTTPRKRRSAALLLPLAAASAAGIVNAPAASAYPLEKHTVTYEIDGPAGHTYSIVATGIEQVLPNGNTYPTLPWSSTTTVSGHPFVSLAFTQRDGGPDNCAILVDGKEVPVSKPSSGMCTYQIPAETLQDRLPEKPNNHQ